MSVALPSFLPEKIQKIIRYVFAGTTAALGNISILFILVQFFHLHYLLASVLSYVGSMALGFTLQKLWAFRDKTTDRVPVQFLFYIAVSTMNLIINTGAMYVFVSIFGIWYIAAQFLSGIIIAVTGYIGYQTFVFNKKTVEPTKN